MAKPSKYNRYVKFKLDRVDAQYQPLDTGMVRDGITNNLDFLYASHTQTRVNWTKKDPIIVPSDNIFDDTSERVPFWREQFRVSKNKLNQTFPLAVELNAKVLNFATVTVWIEANIGIERVTKTVNVGTTSPNWFEVKLDPIEFIRNSDLETFQTKADVESADSDSTVRLPLVTVSLSAINTTGTADGLALYSLHIREFWQ